MRDVVPSYEVDPNCTHWRVMSYLPTLLFLTLLYTLQGVIFGLTSAMTFLLQTESSKYDYQALAEFSLVAWPVSLKLFWAPIVESVYSVRFGRRKSWIVPTTFTIGTTLLLLSTYVDNWLGRKPGGSLATGSIKILPLTAIFCWLVFLTSTLDIAVDGLTLAELPKQSVGWISACSVIGLAFGHYLSYVIVLSIEYPSIWSWDGRTPGTERVSIITLSGFLRFWGVIFLSTAFAVAIFKREGHSTLWLPSKIYCDVLTRKFPLLQTNVVAGSSRRFHCLPCTVCISRRQRSPETLEEAINRITFISSADPVNVVEQTLASTPGFRSAEDYLPPQGVTSDASGLTNDGMMAHIKATPLDAYIVLLRVSCLKAVLKLFLVIFLTRFCFAPMEAIFTPYLAEQGFPMNHLALLMICILPVRWFLPLLAVRWTTRAALLQTYIKLGLARICVCSLAIPLVYTSYFFRRPLKTNQFPHYSNKYWPFPSGHYELSWSYYLIYIAFALSEGILGECMVFFALAFFARVSDPQFGGSYITLFTTCSYSAGSLWNTVSLHLMGRLTKRKCVRADPMVAGYIGWRAVMNHSDSDAMPRRSPSNNELNILGRRWITEYASCLGGAGNNACRLFGGQCAAMLDGFFLEFSVCLFVGLVAFPCILRPLAIQLDALPSSAFTVRTSRPVCCVPLPWRRTENTTIE